MELEPPLGSTVRLRVFEPLVVTVSVDEWYVRCGHGIQCFWAIFSLKHHSKASFVMAFR